LSLNDYKFYEATEIFYYKILSMIDRMILF